MAGGVGNKAKAKLTVIQGGRTNNTNRVPTHPHLRPLLIGQVQSQGRSAGQLSASQFDYMVGYANFLSCQEKYEFALDELGPLPDPGEDPEGFVEWIQNEGQIRSELELEQWFEAYKEAEADLLLWGEKQLKRLGLFTGAVADLMKQSHNPGMAGRLQLIKNLLAWVTDEE